VPKPLQHRVSVSLIPVFSFSSLASPINPNFDMGIYFVFFSSHSGHLHYFDHHPPFSSFLSFTFHPTTSDIKPQPPQHF